MKLNRKGYLTVEIILASVITFIIAFFLIEITMKLVNKTDDTYNDTLFYTEKALITKELKEAIEEDLMFKKINTITDDCIFTFKNDYQFKIKVKKDEETGSSVLIYGPYEDNVMEDINNKQEYNDNMNSVLFLNDTKIENNSMSINNSTKLLMDTNWYEKVINNNLKIGEPQCILTTNEDYIFIKIPLSNTFSEKNKYDVNIIIDNTQRNQPD